MRTLIIAGLLVASLPGCGRRGDLEPAPDPTAAAAAAETPTLAPIAERTRRVPITPPHQPFVLDPLL